MIKIIAVVCIIAGIGFVLMRKKKTHPEKSVPKPSPPPKATPEIEFQSILESLLSLNILIRKDPLFPDEMQKKIEAIIDDLRVITPAMMERYPSEALTYEIRKIGQQHLFKTVKEYLDLSEDSRKNQADIFEKTVESLHEVSNRSRDIVEKNETAEFKTMANFLAGKFS